MEIVRSPFEKALYERRKLLYNVLYMKMGVYGVKCMKCGRDVEAGQVFCADCLKDMAKHPVNPNTVIRIPRRQDPAARRALRRKSISDEEQIRSLRMHLRIRTWLLAICLALLMALMIPAVQHLAEDHGKLLPGQNYSSASRPEEKID